MKSPEDLPELHVHLPLLYKYPEDGSILMPEIPDIYEDIPVHNNRKRSAFAANIDDHSNNKRKCC
jgi:hypothetical protein